MAERQDDGFRVVDKRGQGREAAAPEAAASEAPEAGPQETLDEVNFVSFLLSLYSSALGAFGQIPHPATGTAEVHLDAGKQMIDILSMLEEKTKGNLSDEENQLLGNILYELRMLYVETARPSQP